MVHICQNAMVRVQHLRNYIHQHWPIRAFWLVFRIFLYKQFCLNISHWVTNTGKSRCADEVSQTLRVYGGWIRIYHVLYSKIYSTFGGLFWSTAGSERLVEAPTFVRLAYGSTSTWIVKVSFWKIIKRLSCIYIFRYNMINTLYS